ncbi:MAG: hypothetical protein RH942_03845 [Kiloniellaceae bacterium]
MSNGKLTTVALREAALKIAEQSGRPLRRDAEHKREQLYLDNDHKKVRLRTSNDRVLTVSASSPVPEEARLDIEGCDALLIAMPTERRGTDRVEAYWLPVAIAIQEVKRAHRIWLDSDPNTKKHNKTFSIWFDEAFFESEMFCEKWSEYRLPITLNLKSG